MSAKMNVPKLRFPEFSGEWEEKKLGEVTTYVDYRGRAPTKTEEGHFLVTAKNIKKGFIDYECSKEYVAEHDYLNVMSKGLPEVGDVLFTTEAPMGNVAQVDDKNIALAQRVIKFRSKKMLSNLYLLHYMLSAIFQKLISEKSIGTTVQGISGKELHRIRLAFPSLNEQTKIATFLTAIDTKIDQLTKKQTLLKQYKKGVMQKIFSQELRFKADDGSEFSGWEEKTLGEIAEINPKTGSLPDEFIYIDLESVDSGTLLKETRISKFGAPSRAQRLLNKDDILFQMVRPYQRNNLFFNKIGNYVASTGYAQIRVNESAQFIYHLLHLDSFVNDVMSHCTGTSYPAINSSDLGIILIQIPSSIEEQTKIATFLTVIDTKIDLATKQLNATKQFKKALLQQMFV
ncbi:MAG: restriction endonuclease subunit S [Sulfurimonas sp.]|jgi:type I restriction enzyme S subunit